jgi:hypothetical protein
MLLPNASSQLVPDFGINDGVIESSVSTNVIEDEDRNTFEEILDSVRVLINYLDEERYKTLLPSQRLSEVKFVYSRLLTLYRAFTGYTSVK